MLQLDTFLPYRLNRLAALTSARLAQVYAAEFGLTIPEWRVLATLGELGEATATTIGKHSAMHKTKVSRAVQKLEDRRWLMRRTDEVDRRVEHLKLTASGHQALRHLVPKMHMVETEIITALSPSNRAALARGLTALEHALLDSTSKNRVKSGRRLQTEG